MAIKFGNRQQPKAVTSFLATQAQTMLQQAMALHQAGQLARAQALYEEILKMQPRHFIALHLLGFMNFEAGNYPKALDLINRAIAIKPDFAAAYCSRGLLLQGMQQFDSAVTSFDKAISISPDFAEAFYNRGNALQDLRQFDAAVASYDKAIAIKPDYAEAYSNRGNALQKLQQFDAAVASCDQAVTVQPSLAEAYCNRGNALKELNQFDAAVASYDQAIAIKPDSSEAYSNRGNVLRDLQQIDAALASYNQAIAINPQYVEAYSNRGLALQALKQLDAAVANFDKAIAIKPDYAEAHNNRGNALKDLRQLDAATASYDKAIGIKPDYAVAYENRLFCLSRSHRVDARQLYSEHLAFGEQFEAPLRATWQAHNNSKDTARCLQIGFVSGDLCSHPVVSFLEPVLEFLSRKSDLSLHAFDTHSVNDEVSRRLRNYFAHWHTIGSLSDADLADKIRAEGIDVLIDLSGHTAHNRLLTFARKPAPIQASWIGYPCTTGLQAMDYFLCDRFWIPQDLAWQFTEKLAYLPASAIFKPSELAPPVGTLPALTNGYITFGSFNHASKITDAVIALWSSLLRRLPTARMSIGGTAPDVHDALTQGFASEGIAAERLTFFPRVSAQDYLALHHQFDICLDTFPYGGATTTVQAGWMGVPTLTLAGKEPRSRYGLDFMSHWGLDEFITTSHEDFVSKGYYWADHLAELSMLRIQMRARFTASALGQPQPFADALETTIRTMWQRWCDGLPPQANDLTGIQQ